MGCAEVRGGYVGRGGFCRVESASIHSFSLGMSGLRLVGKHRVLHLSQTLQPTAPT